MYNKKNYVLIDLFTESFPSEYNYINFAILKVVPIFFFNTNN